MQGQLLQQRQVQVRKVLNAIVEKKQSLDGQLIQPHRDNLYLVAARNEPFKVDQQTNTFRDRSETTSADV